MPKLGCERGTVGFNTVDPAVSGIQLEILHITCIFSVWFGIAIRDVFNKYSICPKHFFYILHSHTILMNKEQHMWYLNQNLPPLKPETLPSRRLNTTWVNRVVLPICVEHYWILLLVYWNLKIKYYYGIHFVLAWRCVPHIAE